MTTIKASHSDSSRTMTALSSARAPLVSLPKALQGLQKADDVTSIAFNWPTLQVGDCKMTDASLSLWSNGSFFFEAYTQTSDSGDVWLVKSIQLIGNPLSYTIPQFDGPTMTESNYPFLFQRWGVFPGQFLPYILSADMTYHC